jgi:hypothetical protein
MNRYLLPDDYFGVIEIFIYSVDYIYNIPHGPGPKKKKKTERQRTWDKLPGCIKKTSDSPRGHKISTRDGRVIDSDLTYKFGNMDRSSHGVFVSKNQTEVNYPL